MLSSESFALLFSAAIALQPIAVILFFFVFDTAPTEIYTLSLHDALPICSPRCGSCWHRCHGRLSSWRSEEHTSELQSLTKVVCRLLLEKKKTYCAAMPRLEHPRLPQRLHELHTPDHHTSHGNQRFHRDPA